MMSQMYHEYLTEDITSHVGHQSTPLWVLDNPNQKHLARIVRGDGQMILVQIIPTFNAG